MFIFIRTKKINVFEPNWTWAYTESMRPNYSFFFIRGPIIVFFYKRPNYYYYFFIRDPIIVISTTFLLIYIYIYILASEHALFYFLGKN